MQVYIDGNLVYQTGGNYVDVYLKYPQGWHQVAVKEWDNTGSSSLAAVSTYGNGWGVFQSYPSPGQTVNGSAHIVADSASGNPITAIAVYDNGNLVTQIGGGYIDTTINLSAGSHYLVVQVWDTTGQVYQSPMTVNSGSAATTSTTQVAGPQAYVPSWATALVDIDQMSGWQSCDACAGAYGSGPVDPYSMTQWISNPSIDGQSATFWLGGSTPWGNALWWKQLGPIDTASHFVYDTYFWVSNPWSAQALEFDVNQSVNGLKYIFGTECGVRTNSGWRVWDTANAYWVSTGASCQVNGNAWNHLTWEVERVGGMTHFIAVTLNGYRQTIDRYFYARSIGTARELNVAFQMDGDEYQDNYQVWLDKVALYAW